MLLRALATSLLLASSSVLSAQTFDAWNDFSASNNPNGVWQYGFRTSLLGPFVRHTFASGLGPTSSGNTTIAQWFSVNPFANVGRIAGSGCGFLGPTAQVCAGELYAHPGLSGEYAVLRFVAPSSADYTLQFAYRGVDIRGTTSDYAVLDGGLVLQQGAVVGFRAPDVGGTLHVTLLAGEAIDFALGDGGNGAGDDSSGFDVVVSESSLGAVPEPASVLLVGTGLFGVGALTRKRKR